MYTLLLLLKCVNMRKCLNEAKKQKGTHDVCVFPYHIDLFGIYLSNGMMIKAISIYTYFWSQLQITRPLS